MRRAIRTFMRTLLRVHTGPRALIHTLLAASVVAAGSSDAWGQMADGSIRNGVEVSAQPPDPPTADPGRSIARTALGPGTVVNFDDRTRPCLFIETSRLTTEYIGFGVSFSGPGGEDGGAILNECGGFFVSGHSSPNFLAFNTGAALVTAGIPRGPETLVFSPTVSSVSLLAGHELGGTLTLEAYNPGDVLVDSASINLNSNLARVSVSAPRIARVVLDATGEVFVVDDLDFAAVVVGACCELLSGSCEEDLLASECSGTHPAWTEGAACADAACQAVTGACCDLLSGVCSGGVTVSGCSGTHQVWTKGAACAEAPCEPVTGACCDLLTGTCAEEVASSACSDPHDVWSEGAVCAVVPCEAVTGACCSRDPFDPCTDDVLQAACTCPTCEWVKLGSCSELDCPPITIPTVGEWGLVALTLLLLTGAKVAFSRVPLPT